MQSPADRRNNKHVSVKERGQGLETHADDYVFFMSSLPDLDDLTLKTFGNYGAHHKPGEFQRGTSCNRKC